MKQYKKSITKKQKNKPGNKQKKPANNSKITYWHKSGLLSILTRCCVSYGVTLEEVRSRTRRESVVFARQAYCYKAFWDTCQSTNNIGELINRDHSTVSHSIKTVKNYLEVDYRRFTDIYNMLLND